MKSRASLFLAVLLLALSLTACGKEPAKNDRNDAGSGQNSAYDAASDLSLIHISEPTRPY